MLRSTPLSPHRYTKLAHPQHSRLSRGPPQRAPHRLVRCRADVGEGTATANDFKQIAHGSDLLEAARGGLEHAFRQTYCYVASDERSDEDEISCMRRKLGAIGRELGSVTEAEYSSLAAAAAAPRLQQPLGSAVVALPPLAPIPVTVPVTPAPAPAPQPSSLAPAPPSPSAAPAAPSSPREGLHANIVPITPRLLERKEGAKPEGTGAEILLQGFNWESWKHGWFSRIGGQAQEIADMGFTVVWLPPFTDSVSEQGYMPRDLYDLNSKYGSEQELISCVKALQSRGIKVLGDAVLNHRCAHFQGDGGKWNRFGGKLAWDERAIVGDQQEYGGRGNRSSGDCFSAAPNIDHSQPFVKRDLCEWMRWLRGHVGFDGWRLDFVKGFHGSHVKDYMEASSPEFVVGEYWDSLAYEWDGTPCHNQDAHRQRTVDWINAAGGLATAFDITTKGIMHAVFERCEYWRLRDAAGKPAGLVGWWPSRSVTFLENHDTGSTQGHWRFPGHALEQGYVYILTHPGTPTVFYDHVYENSHLRHVVQRLIETRKRNRIHCRSTVKILKAERDVYVAEIDGKVLMKIGPGDFAPSKDEYSIADCGHCWAIWEKKQ